MSLLIDTKKRRRRNKHDVDNDVSLLCACCVNEIRLSLLSPSLRYAFLFVGFNSLLLKAQMMMMMIRFNYMLLITDTHMF